jgi:signal peptidase
MKNKKMNPKVKKVLGIAANVLTGLIVVVAMVIAISTIMSKDKKYVNLMGFSYLSVASDSMEGNNKDSFNYGDVIMIRILNDSQKDSLKVGQVITFIDPLIQIDGISQLNTHRIVEVVEQNGIIHYRTKGDHNPTNDPVLRPATDVVGVYISKSNGIGKALLWMQTKDGFLASVVVPSALVFIYCLVMVIKNVMEYSKNKVMRSMAEKEAEKEAELRERILKELQAEKKEEEKA